MRNPFKLYPTMTPIKNAAPAKRVAVFFSSVLDSTTTSTPTRVCNIVAIYSKGMLYCHMFIARVVNVNLHCHRPEAFYQILTCLIWALWVHVTYLFTKCVTESCDSPDWLIQYCLSSASSRVTETVSMKMPCGECFQKCFSANNVISLWLNTVIPIIVMIWLPNMTRYLQWRITYRHLTLVTF